MEAEIEVAHARPPEKSNYTVLIALLATVVVFGISFAGILPWVALVLEKRGTDPVMIGIVSAMTPVGTMLMAPFSGRIMRLLGTADAILIGSLVAIASTALLPVFDSTAGWLILRLISGLGGAVPWVATETWINVLAEDRNRGRVVSVYGASLSLGFATGPLVLIWVGVEGPAAIIMFTLLALVALLPILVIRRCTVYLDTGARRGGVSILAAMPTVFAAVFVAGMVDTAFFAFLPIWAVRLGIDQALALSLLSIFIAGNIALQIPVGWLADKIGTRRVMALCGSLSVAGPVAAMVWSGSPVLLGAVLFTWGGAVWALYTLAMIDIGHRCRGAVLATASGVLVVVFTVSDILGPPLAGVAMEIWNPHGLMIVAGVSAALFLVLLAIRSGRASDRRIEPGPAPPD